MVSKIKTWPVLVVRPYQPLTACSWHLLLMVSVTVFQLCRHITVQSCTGNSQRHLPRPLACSETEGGCGCTRGC